MKAIYISSMGAVSAPVEMQVEEEIREKIRRVACNAIAPTATATLYLQRDNEDWYMSFATVDWHGNVSTGGLRTFYDPEKKGIVRRADISIRH